MLLFVRFLLDYHYTLNFDIIFPDRATYDLVRDSGVLSRASVCRAGRVKAERVFADRAHRPIVAEQWPVAASDGKILLVQA